MATETISSPEKSQSSNEEADFDASLSSLHETEKGKVLGVFGRVSPMKRGKSGKEYFHAQLSDGNDDVKVVGFGHTHRNLLKDFAEKREAVVLRGYCIKQSKYSGGGTEVLLRPDTDFVVSPKKLKIDPERFTGKEDLQVKDVDKVSRFKRVSLRAKVIREEAEAIVPDGLKVQNVIVADSTKAVKLAIWENDIGCVEPQKSYYFQDVVVNSFQGDKYLQLPKEGAKVQEVEDIGDVVEDDMPMFEKVSGCEVAGVLNFDCFISSLGCKSKVLKKNDVSGTCSRCGMVQKVERCSKQLRALLLVTLPGGGYEQMSAFGKHLEVIAGTEEVSEDSPGV